MTVNIKHMIKTYSLSNIKTLHIIAYPFTIFNNY